MNDDITSIMINVNFNDDDEQNDVVNSNITIDKDKNKDKDKDNRKKFIQKFIQITQTVDFVKKIILIIN